MDYSKIGKLIFALRKEKQMTQKQLADAMNLSDRTISKWERGLGCPDVSLLYELSALLGVNIEQILSGELEEGERGAGNMKQIQFYVCPACGNILWGTGKMDVSCCGRRLTALKAQKEEPPHEMHVQEVENEYYITVPHEMTKSHYLSFIASVSYDRVLVVKLYPEQDACVRIPRIPRADLYLYCSEHGLWRKEKNSF
jgi:DNA-binding XRE family transcriptional regulator/desulfoferrodoxin (superoxide reductase-like protein)